MPILLIYGVRSAPATILEILSNGCIALFLMILKNLNASLM